MLARTFYVFLYKGEKLCPKRKPSLRPSPPLNSGCIAALSRRTEKQGVIEGAHEHTDIRSLLDLRLRDENESYSSYVRHQCDPTVSDSILQSNAHPARPDYEIIVGDRTRRLEGGGCLGAYALQRERSVVCGLGKIRTSRTLRLGGALRLPCPACGSLAAYVVALALFRCPSIKTVLQ